MKPIVPAPPAPIETELYPGAYDEMVTGSGEVRAGWRGLLGAISSLPKGALADRDARARQQFADDGVTYNVHADPRADDRPYRFDVVPLVIEDGEWAALESGLIQRAKVLEAVLDDAYGRQDLVRRGAYPPGLLYANPNFLRPWRYALPPGRWHLNLLAVDLIRAPDGRWHVVSDRTQAPNGIGFALENRRVLARAFPEGLRAVAPRPLRAFFDLWQSQLNESALGRSANPRGIVLSGGPASDFYFEHIYLARELGYTLSEGEDLTSRDGKLFLKTLGGLHMVDVVLGRIASHQADPLELDPDSGVGVPGLIDAAREGSVTLVNGLGCGLIESPAFAQFLPGLAQDLIGEDLSLPTLERLWLGEPEARAILRAEAESFSIRPTYEGKAMPRMVKAMSAREREAVFAAIEAEPHAYTAQRLAMPSVAPTWTPTGLQPRPVILRVFLVRDGDGFAVMPGGLARVTQDGNLFQLALQRGGVAKDVWVLSAERPGPIVPGPRDSGPVEIKRTSGEVPSRAADNLYWLGRYLERLDMAARLLRAALLRLVGGGLGAREILDLGALARVAAEMGLIDAATASAPSDGRWLAGALTGEDMITALGDLFDRTARTMTPARDRFSADMWSNLGYLLSRRRDALEAAIGDPDRLLGALSGILRAGAGLAGMASENMTRGTGWRFHDLGRRLERALQTLDTIKPIVSHPGATTDSASALILELCDSTITYRTRYLSALRTGLVLDIALADDTNPRSVAFQLVAILRHLRQVPGTIDTGGPREASADLALIESSLAMIDRIDYASMSGLGDLVRVLPDLDAIGKELQAASDALGRRHFSHVESHPILTVEG